MIAIDLTQELLDTKRQVEMLKTINACYVQQEEILLQRITRIWELTDMAPAIIYILQGDYFCYVNNAFVERISCTKEEALAITAWEFIHPEDREKTRNNSRYRMEGKDIPPYEAKLLTRNGTSFWGYLSADVIQWQDKPAILGIILDISERKQAEEAMRLSDEKFSKAFVASPNLITISTLEEGRYIDVNDKFFNITGYSRDEAIGFTAEELHIWVSPEERHKLVEAVRKYGSVRNLEIRLRRKSGEIFEGLVSSEIIELNGEMCMINILADITEHKRISREMARLDQMNLVGEIAASIAHEIRNPITSVRGFLQLFTHIEHLSEYQEFFDIMLEELDRANHIITEFLLLAKNKTIDLHPNNLKIIVGAISPLIRADALNQDKYLQLQLEEVPDILLDENEIRQLVLNLVRNGLEAMPPGKTIHIRTCVQGEDVLLIVQDEGLGIPHDILPRISTPFFTTKESGTGLGLPVCYSIAARHGAIIEIDTKPNNTSFIVRFRPPGKPLGTEVVSSPPETI